MSKHKTNMSSYAKYSSLAPKKEEKKFPSVLEIQDLEHRKKVINENSVVIIDSYADWCQPCKLLIPEYEELASKYKGSCLFVKENIDKELTTEHNITGIPAFIFYKQGRPVSDENDKKILLTGWDKPKIEKILEQLCQ